MGQAFQTTDFSNDTASFERLKHLVVSASRHLPKGDVLELADALHDELRDRRGAVAQRHFQIEWQD